MIPSQKQEQGKNGGCVDKKAASEPVQTDPKVLWRGWSGPVEIEGMRFCVTKKRVGDNATIKIVNVLTAPQGTELHGLGGTNVYVTVVQLHFREFQSRLREGSSKWLEQKRIWDFLHSVFIANGIKTTLRANPTVTFDLAQGQRQEQGVKTSASIGDFIPGTPGWYCFDEHSPQAVFRVKFAACKLGVLKQVQVVKLESVEAGHPLYGYSRPGTFLYHNTLAWGKMPNFKGSHAGDSQKMWEFLTDMLTEHYGAHAVATAM